MNTVAESNNTLYTFALDCATHKQENSCARICSRCASNIALYTKDQRMAVMIQHTAELEVAHNVQALQRLEAHRQERADRITAQDKEFRGVMLILYVLLISVPLICFTCIRYTDKMAKVKPQQSISSLAGEIPVPGTIDNSPPPALYWDAGVDPDIAEALYLIKRIDVDRDNSAGCVDYVIQFYRNYPYKSKVRIIWNVGANMNHLFVKIDGVAIECSAFLPGIRRNDNAYRVEDFFTYYPAYDHDVTAYKEQILDGTFSWRLK
jgi:hypothetical protein